MRFVVAPAEGKSPSDHRRCGHRRCGRGPRGRCRRTAGPGVRPRASHRRSDGCPHRGGPAHRRRGGLLHRLGSGLPCGGRSLGIRRTCRPWTDTFAVASGNRLESTTSGPMRFATAYGVRSLVEELAGDLKIRHPLDVSEVADGPRVDGVAAEAVVLAMPDPQALDLLADVFEAERAIVADRDWRPVLALYARWEQRLWPRPRWGLRQRQRRAGPGRGRRAAPWRRRSGVGGPLHGTVRGALSRRSRVRCGAHAALDVRATRDPGRPRVGVRQTLVTCRA